MKKVILKVGRSDVYNNEFWLKLEIRYFKLKIEKFLNGKKCFYYLFIKLLGLVIKIYLSN